MRHSNGAPLVRIFGPQDMDRRGGTIAFYLLDPAGEPFDVRRRGSAGRRERISLRTGCFCNPATVKWPTTCGVRKWRSVLSVTRRRCLYSSSFELIHRRRARRPAPSACRSGVASNFADVSRFLDFVDGFRDRRAADLDRVGAEDFAPSGPARYGLESGSGNPNSYQPGVRHPCSKQHARNS